MKYTITDPTSEKKLAEVDSSDLVSEKVQIEQTGSIFRVQGKDSLSLAIARGSKSRQFMIASAIGHITVQIDRGETAILAGAALNAKKTVKSSMPGKILRVMCKEGDVVQIEQPLLVIEAMKMENEIRSPKEGVIEKIMVDIGRAIETGESLLVIK